MASKTSVLKAPVIGTGFQGDRFWSPSFAICPQHTRYKDPIARSASRPVSQHSLNELDVYWKHPGPSQPFLSQSVSAAILLNEVAGPT